MQKKFLLKVKWKRTDKIYHKTSIALRVCICPEIHAALLLYSLLCCGQVLENIPVYDLISKLTIRNDKANLVFFFRVTGKNLFCTWNHHI